MKYVVNANRESFEAYQLTKENAQELMKPTRAVLVQEIDAENPDLIYVGLNVLTGGAAFRVSEGEWLLHNTGTGQWFKVSPGYFERDYKEI
jgi:hypothetical protein